MSGSSQLGYVQTRLQARHGQRPTEADWRLLEATPDLAAYLQAARRTTLSPWIAHMPAELDSHRVERSLRDDWAGYVHELASWAPEAWRPAIAWFATAPMLPCMVHLARGEFVPPWMRTHPLLGRYAVEEAVPRASALAESPMFPTLEAVMAGQLPLAAWMDQWLGMVPAGAVAERARLKKMAEAMVHHFQRIAEQPANVVQARSHRDAIFGDLLRRFRRFARTPVAIFAFLGMAQMDFERLRGGLVLRALFPDPAGRPRWA